MGNRAVERGRAALAVWALYFAAWCASATWNFVKDGEVGDLIKALLCAVICGGMVWLAAGEAKDG